MSAHTKIMDDFLHFSGMKGVRSEADEAVEFIHEDLVARIYPHPNGESLILEVKVMRIDLGRESGPQDRYLVLHRINAVTRFMNGSVAVLDEGNVLTLSCTLALQNMESGPALATRVTEQMERARSLKQNWDRLDVGLAERK